MHGFVAFLGMIETNHSTFEISRKKLVEFPETMRLGTPIFLWDKGERLPLPDWAKAHIWLGWWCRKLQIEGARVLAVAVLPTRELATAFVGLGSLLAGSQLFRGGFSWGDFRDLPPGSEVFWKTPADNTRYEGVVLEGENSNLVPVKIRKGKRRDIDAIWSFSASKFAECLFSEENLPTERRSAAMENAMRLHGDLGLDTNPRWIWTAGHEAHIVTNQTRFWESLSNLQIGVQNSAPVPFIDVLSAARGNDRTLAKLRITSVGHVSERDEPLTILDGDFACGRIRQFDSGNVLMLLDRAEYTADIHNELLDAYNMTQELSSEASQDLPTRFPPGVELSVFVLPSGR